MIADGVASETDAKLVAYAFAAGYRMADGDAPKHLRVSLQGG